VTLTRRSRAIAIVSCLAGLVLPATGVGSSATGQQSGRLPAVAARPPVPARPGAPVATKHFTGAFQPDQLVTTDGEVWLVSSENGAGKGCRIGRLRTKTLALTSYALSTCGLNVTAGLGAIFLETTAANVKSETYAIHIERFSTSSHVSTVYRTVSATMFLGSDIAHTQLAYVGGALWFYAWLPAGAEVLELSSETGAVERVFRSVPQIGGAEPIITGAGGQVWLAGGAGSGADFLRIDVRSGASRVVQLPGRYASVYNLASVGASLFLLYLVYPSAIASTSAALPSHVARFNASGELKGVSPNEQVATWLVPLSGRLFAVGPDNSCAPPALVQEVNELSLRTSVIAKLLPPGGPCSDDSAYRSVGVAGHSIFVLFGGPPATLYRVTPPTGG
jgi:hypothetical protein